MTLTLIATVAEANPLEKLLMPGPLTRSHAELEGECGKCHDRTDKSRQSALCLDCHKEVAADIRAAQGFHGRKAKASQCNACHTEHKGRAADIVRLDRGNFDHRQTDFVLKGGHAVAGCDSCHQPGKKFREAPTQCVDCHRKDDFHKGKLGKDCGQCHEPAAFKPATFDHSKTRFPLVDAHAQVSCSACHRDTSFKNAPTRCVDCHSADDVHRGKRGPDCATCHQTTSWTQSRFDHAKVTGYALEGQHRSLKCDACHRGGDLKASLPNTCSGCHAAADRHSGRLGPACADCHSQQEWKVASFDHEKRSTFALRGAHASVDCHACHTGVLKEQQLAKDCQGCHAADDAHAGSLGRDCQSCHNESGWRERVKFDHDFARFPLVGLHVGVPCEECHATRSFRQAPVACVACHKAKDVHEGRLGDQCATCHNSNGWDFWQFDHAKQANFALDGAHERLGCRDCHRDTARKLSQSRECSACHFRDDIHDGRLGRDCSRCHNTGSFRHAVLN